MASPIINLAHQNCALGTTDEASLTHDNDTASMVLWFSFGIVHSVALDKCMMTCIPPHGGMQNVFTVLQILLLIVLIHLSSLTSMLIIIKNLTEQFLSYCLLSVECSILFLVLI